MFCFKRSVSIALTALTFLGVVSLTAHAEEPTTAAGAPSDPARIDRDGKKICGFDLMTESERAGFRSTLYFTKELKDRDVIRTESCARMRKRAAEKGVKLDE